MTEKHTLITDFPEFKETIHTLKTTDHHFRRLFDEYDIVTTELHRYAEGLGATSDENAEELKKKALHLKDELYFLLKKSAA